MFFDCSLCLTSYGGAEIMAASFTKQKNPNNIYEQKN